jgi:hypothetical protein
VLKSIKRPDLDPGKVHFGHLMIEILKIMDSDGMMYMAAVFPVPDFQLPELAGSRYKDAEGPPHIFNRIIRIHLFFKSQFTQLLVIYRNDIQVIGFKPVILVPVMHTNLPVFMVQFPHFSLKTLTSEICLKYVPNLDILKSDHIAIIYGYEYKKIILKA